MIFCFNCWPCSSNIDAAKSKAKVIDFAHATIVELNTLARDLRNNSHNCSVKNSSRFKVFGIGRSLDMKFCSKRGAGNRYFYVNFHYFSSISKCLLFYKN